MASASFENKKRTIVPRWRESKQNTETSELASFGPRPVALGDAHLHDKIAQWATTKNVSTAAELLTSAIVLHKPDVAREVSDYLARSKTLIPDALRHVALSIVEPLQNDGQLTLGPTFLSRERIRQLKARLQEYPRDAVTWVDIAREYTILGQIESAKHAMNIAVAIAPCNRFILRSAARFYVHSGDSDRAHDILLQSATTPSDPWLIAAELAVAPLIEAAPEFVREARQMLRAGTHAARHLNEMASALATLEMEGGRQKLARKLFRFALNEATENTVAQVNWATQYIGSFDIDPSVCRVPRLYEAMAWSYYSNGDWKKSFDETRKWLDDQPFSRLPAIHGSFIACMLLDDYTGSEDIARAGLVANPRDVFLLNNLTVALAKGGKTQEASAVLARIIPSSLTSDDRIVWLATCGLVQFRSGNREVGRKLYRLSMDLSQTNKRELLQMRAALSLAIEEVAASTPESGASVEYALQLAKDSQDKATIALSQRLALLVRSRTVRVS